MMGVRPDIAGRPDTMVVPVVDAGQLDEPPSTPPEPSPSVPIIPLTSPVNPCRPRPAGPSPAVPDATGHTLVW
jgi:hypothetical protein